MVPGIMKPDSLIPRATYRLQLNRDFTFNQARAILPYLSAIGISHCYISPCLKARPGSMHGYDIVDHNALNPEIGTPEEFDQFVSALHEHGMGLILDIVPNHMGVMGSDNAWWLDVLENGEASTYATFFDIDWDPLKEELHGKILVPVLHDHYGTVLESGDLKLVFRAEQGEFDICYKTHRFPVNPREYPRILQSAANKLAARVPQDSTDLLELQSLNTAFGHLPARQEANHDQIIERNRDKEIHKRRLAELCTRSPQVTTSIQDAVAALNGNPSDPSSFNALHELIKAQAYRLANWRVASDDINYRRFFDTNDLAALRMENENVFEATHRLVLKFVAEGKVNGLRVDHPDGLYDPARYFERLDRAMADAVNQSATDSTEPGYLVIEKILTGKERLRREWPICGTTGYDFANLVNGLFVDTAAEARMDRVYHAFVGQELDYEDIAYRSRRLIIRVALASELSVLAYQLTRIALTKRHTCDFTMNNLRDALTEVVANFPVYRTYVNSSDVSEDDALYIRTSIVAAKRRSPAGDTSVFDFISQVLLTSIADGHDDAYRRAVTAFAMKFQQFTSPVMAKGLEDTAFYRYNRLVSLNDVGGDLRRFGVTLDEFHLANGERQRDWPHTMLATSTHDSKRSEDVRARINLLSEMSLPWKLHARDWKRFNRIHAGEVDGRPVPSPNDEYALYQTLIGAWPLRPLTDSEDLKKFGERIVNYMLKAVREGKQNTSWINQNAEYEKGISSFINAILTPGAENRFLNDFIPFQKRIARLGLWNSVSQTLLKLTSPGVPDIYQGNEVWDFSLVDPDNRRPVDYGLRREVFESLRKLGSSPDESSLSAMLKTPEDGRLKLYVTWKTLCAREQWPDVFREGEYIPLAVQGEKADHVVAFLRKHGGTTVLVVVPRLVSALLGESDQPPTGSDVWEDTQIVLPSRPDRTNCRNVFTGALIDGPLSAGGSLIPVSEILKNFPVALCAIV
jgi:(1->4)-alpha-D-glucan 1-alpha-D-glucosylmutase